MELLLSKIEVDEEGRPRLPTKGSTPELMRRRAKAIGKSIEEKELDEVMMARILELEIMWQNHNREFSE